VFGHGEHWYCGLHGNRARWLGRPVGHDWARQGISLVGQFQGRSRIRLMALYIKKPFSIPIFLLFANLFEFKSNSNAERLLFANENTGALHHIIKYAAA
jgi:hypothetical protein